VTRRPAILVVRFGALGDVVLTTPLLRALHRAHPDARVTMVTKAEWAPLLEGHPHVTQVVPFHPGTPLRSLARRLRDEAWDHRLDLHGSLRSRALRRLVGGRWHGWHKPRVRRALRVWAGIRTGPPIQPVAEQYFASVRPLGIVPDGGPPEIHPTESAERAAAAVLPAGPFVALAVGASRPTKRWPPAHWNRLASLLQGRGLATVAVGSTDDRGRIATATDASGIGLGPTAAVLRRAAVVVAHDSGLMHLATGVGTPVVALFGPTDPALGYGPYRAAADVLARDLPCRPCSVYGSAHCPLRHQRCMIELMPETVADAVLSRVP
jgi:heptosyltransferase-2